MQNNKMIANSITLSRIPLSLSLLVLSPFSSAFVILYLMCGLTDIADGFFARRLHTESKAGGQLDSAADLVFAAVYAVKILPLLRVPFWIWVWVAAIAAIKLWGIFQSCKTAGSFCITHSFANRLTGFLVFLLPVTLRLNEMCVGAVIVCTAATLAAADDILAVKRHRMKKGTDK